MVVLILVTFSIFQKLFDEQLIVAFAVPFWNNCLRLEAVVQAKVSRKANGTVCNLVGVFGNSQYLCIAREREMRNISTEKSLRANYI